MPRARLFAMVLYRWYDRYQTGGPEALEDRPSRPSRVWNRISDEIRQQILALALEETELSTCELAVRFTDGTDYLVREQAFTACSRLTT
jgi:hypothetical protein